MSDAVDRMNALDPDGELACDLALRIMIDLAAVEWPLKLKVVVWVATAVLHREVPASEHAGAIASLMESIRTLMREISP